MLKFNSKLSRGRLICFIGNDGSGKSTLARATFDILKSNGGNWKYLWGGYKLILLWPVIKTFKLLHFSDPINRVSYEQYHNKLKKLRNKQILYFIYRVFMTIDHMIQISAKVRLPLALGVNVFCDRYIFDTAVALASNYGLTEEEYDRLLARYLRFCPRPDLIFHVHVSDETAMQRKEDIPAMSYLRKRRRFYERLLGQENVISLNGEDEIPALLNEIRNNIATSIHGIEGLDL